MEITKKEVPVGKKDSGGNLITNHAGLKKLYLDTYLNRLRNRPIKTDFEQIKEMKNDLFNEIKYQKERSQSHGR